MKKALLLLLVFCLLCPLFSSCGVNINLSNYIYNNEDQYSVGGATVNDTVKNIEIDWISGDIDIKHYDGEGISISEQSKKEISENLTMRYCVEEDTLKIKFAASGKWNFNALSKRLTILIPKGMELTDIEIDTVSSVVRATEIECRDLTVDTVSAAVILDKCAIEDIDIETVSGIVRADVTEINHISIETVSGKATVKAKAINMLHSETVSGGIEITGDSLGRAYLETISGDVTINIPDNGGYTVTFDSTSGEISSDMPVKKNGNRYIIGDGTTDIKVETTSGDVNIVGIPTESTDSSDNNEALVSLGFYKD